MLTSNVLRLLLLGAASAAPAPDRIGARQDADLIDPRVAVDNAGVTKTIAPVTASKELPTLLADVTNGVRAEHAHDSETAGTGAHQSKPTDGKTAEDVAACHNTDGEFAPFCLPKNNDVFYPNSKHMIRWDTSYFPGANTTLRLHGFYVTNETVIPAVGPPADAVEAFSSDEIDAAWGYHQWDLPKRLLSSQKTRAVNITLRMVALPAKGQSAQWLTGPTVTLKYKEKPPKAVKPHTKHADNDLYIALPIVFGFAALMIIMTLLGNRQLRRVNFAGIVRRSRSFGNKGRKGRAREMDKEQSIRLMEREGGDDWDEGWRDSEEAGGRRVFERLDRKGR